MYSRNAIIYTNALLEFYFKNKPCLGRTSENLRGFTFSFYLYEAIAIRK